MISDSLDLTMIKVISYLGGARIMLDQKKMDHLNTLPFVEEKDDLCFGLTVRLFEVNKTYIVVFGEPPKDEWYDKALVVDKHIVDQFLVSNFERPETH